MYKGYIEGYFNNENLAAFYENPNLIAENLKENQYFIIKNLNEEIIDKYKKQNGELNQVSYKTIKNSYMGYIKPRNLEQELAFDLLDDTQTKVKLIRGVYGSGKDYIMFAKALELLEKGTHKKIIYIRPNVTVRDVPEIGHLPNGVFEKLSWTLGPLYDKVGGVEGVKLLIEQDKLELMPLLFIRGRSFEDCIIYVSEGQNITTEIAKLLLGRVGENSILLINADNHQTDNKIYDNDNGIAAMIDKLSGNKLFGYVYLNETLRSETANLANLLD